jgi:hypothetical protein
MSLTYSDGVAAIRFLDALRDLASAHPDYTVTATGMATRTGVSLENARAAMVRATGDGLLESHLVAKCQQCGAEHSIDDVDELNGAVCAGACGRRTDHDPYVVFNFTPAMLQLVEGRQGPKQKRRRRAPLLERLGQRLIEISRRRATS